MKYGLFGSTLCHPKSFALFKGFNRCVDFFLIKSKRVKPSFVAANIYNYTWCKPYTLPTSPNHTRL